MWKGRVNSITEPIEICNEFWGMRSLFLLVRTDLGREDRPVAHGVTIVNNLVNLAVYLGLSIKYNFS